MKFELENIFRPNDIRGIYGKDLNEETAEKIGKAFGTLLGEKKNIVVGRDVRLSSKSLRDSLVKGLISSGCNVIDIGVVPTPVFYFALYARKFDAGIMITASHNPPEWNGFHLYEKMNFLSGEKIEKLKEVMIKEKFKEPESRGKVKRYGKILQEYMNFLLAKVKVKKKLKIVVDCSNGCASLIVPKILKKLGQKAVVLNSKIDGRFPAHGPEAKEETLNQLKEKVIKEKADFGVGLDGDADRAVFVDDKGRVLSGDRASVVFLEDLFNRKKYPKILNEVSCSSAIEEYIKNKKSFLRTCRRGHAFIQVTMRKEKIDFGFERSSHFYFKELKGFDDATFAILKMVEIVSKSGKSISRIIDSIHFYPTKEESFFCDDKIKLKVIEDTKKEILKMGLKTNLLDGVKAFVENGWFLIRASITEPMIRVTAEAKDEESLKSIFNFASKLLKMKMNKYMCK